MQPSPDVCVPSSTLQEIQSKTFMEAWSKVESCYTMSIARIQRLREAAAQPHSDIRPSEAETACRMSEHLLYLVQRGREALSNFSKEMKGLNGIVRFLDDLAVDPTIEPQSASASRLTRNLQTSSQIVRLAHETEELLSAAARLDPSPENSNNLFSASSAARNIWRKLDKCLSNVVSMSNSSVGFDANGQEVFVTPSIINSLNVLNGIINDLSKEISGSEHGEAPGWSHLANVFLSAVSVYQEVDGRPNQGMVNNKHSLADDIEKLVESCLLWAQNESFLARRQESMESVKEAEQGKELVLAYVNAIKRNNTSGLGLVNDRALSCVKKLATLSDSSGDSCLRSNAELLVTTRTLLKVLFAASWHTGCHLMALHRAISKLTYITCGLLATVVQDGFCMPEQEGEEATEGETKEMHGTGLADGDTRGAKDISDEIENEDQVLGAQQAGQETQEQQEQDEKGASRGIEMEDDFEGALEDVQQDVDNDQDESLDEEDGDADRLDQQMGDVGEEGMEVDERLWNEEDVGDDKKEENYDQKQTLDMKDKTNLDYAQGQDKQEEGADDDEDDRKKSTSVEKQERQADDAFDEEDTPGDDPEGNDTAEGQPDEGRAQLEQPDAELQVPENWDLDDGEAPDDEKAGEQGEDEEDRLEELQQAQDGKKEDDVDEDGDSEMKQAQDIENTDNPEANEGGGEQNAAPFDEIDEGQNNEEEKDKEAELIGDDRQDGASVIPEDAVQRGDHGKTGPAEAPMPLEGLTSNDIENQTDATGIDAAVAPAGGEATGPGGGLEDMMVNEQSNYQDREHSQGPQQRDAGKRKNTPQTNPFRNLGSAIEEWRKRLAVVADLDGKPEDDDGGEQEADEQENEVVDQGAHRFLGKDEAPRLDKDAQVLAQATDEQMDTQMAEGDVAMIDNNDDVDDQPAMDGFDDFQANEEKATQTAEKKDMETTGGSKVDKVSRLHGEVPVMKESGSTENDPQPYDSPENDPDLDPTFDAGLESLISSKFQATRIDDEDVLNLKETMLSTDRAAIIREELTKRLEAVQLMGPTAGDTDYGRQVWERCEMLTSSLVGELTEQLRLILEPTIASKMGGEYRTGKRINMKRVITYIASHFRKDKIWMRRSRPDKRKYQVLIAVDNSRSMAETGCGPFALEAVTLIARAMARLEVGEMGVVSFGGPGGAQPLHEFSENFSEADGIRILSTLRFDQDNTIKDKPMEDVILSIDALLENASLKFSSTSGGTGSLHQLVLIVADGRFHEKESLQLAVRNAAERPGVLYAFLVLDNSANSVLDMQSVTFENGIPLFTKYIDSFPFPYYIVLRNTAALPRTLADLLRQWFEMQQGH